MFLNNILMKILKQTCLKIYLQISAEHVASYIKDNNTAEHSKPFMRRYCASTSGHDRKCKYMLHDELVYLFRNV